MLIHYSTEPIHLVLQYLRESFSLSQGEATPYRFLLIHYKYPIEIFRRYIEFTLF
ncbi:hypothetical protein I7R55_06485 [Neisseria meningitidis]|nr:hypothetical protein [Neisseria meningitidis]